MRCASITGASGFCLLGGAVVPPLERLPPAPSADWRLNGWKTAWRRPRCFPTSPPPWWPVVCPTPRPWNCRPTASCSWPNRRAPFRCGRGAACSRATFSATRRSPPTRPANAACWASPSIRTMAQIASCTSITRPGAAITTTASAGLRPTPAGTWPWRGAKRCCWNSIPTRPPTTTAARSTLVRTASSTSAWVTTPTKTIRPRRRTPSASPRSTARCSDINPDGSIPSDNPFVAQTPASTRQFGRWDSATRLRSPLSRGPGGCSLTTWASRPGRRSTWLLARRQLRLAHHRGLFRPE